MRHPVIVAGFFPPPITGQGIATERLAELLGQEHQIIKVNLREDESDLDLKVQGRVLEKVNGYIQAGRRLKTAIRKHPEATVLWTAISPQLLGHIRDNFSIMPQYLTTNKVYGVVHWGRFAQLFQSYQTSFTAKKMLKRLEGLVFLNEDRASDCKQWVPADKRFVIPNTLDDEVICAAGEVFVKQQSVKERDEIRLLFLSHMIKEKGYLDVLEAIRILNQKQIPVQATFAGQWISENDKVQFNSFLETHNLTSVVKHLGPIKNRSEVKKLHLASDVFLLPSYMIEGQPLSIVEAMNAGSPVITSNLGGVIDMISHGKEGFCVEPKKPEEIAAAVAKLRNKELWLKQSKAVTSRYFEDYSPEKVLLKWNALLG